MKKTPVNTNRLPVESILVLPVKKMTGKPSLAFMAPRRLAFSLTMAGVQHVHPRSWRAAGRLSGAACAKGGPIGQMQISAELVPIPDASRIRPDTSGYVRMRRDFEFQQTFGKILAKSNNI